MRSGRTRRHEVGGNPLAYDLIARKGVALGVTGIGASSVGAFALGAVAIGAIAIGALAIGRLAIGKARISHLEIDELVVGRLRIRDTQPRLGIADWRRRLPRAAE